MDSQYPNQEAGLRIAQKFAEKMLICFAATLIIGFASGYYYGQKTIKLSSQETQEIINKLQQHNTENRNALLTIVEQQAKERIHLRNQLSYTSNTQEININKLIRLEFWIAAIGRHALDQKTINQLPFLPTLGPPEPPRPAIAEKPKK